MPRATLAWVGGVGVFVLWLVMGYTLSCLAVALVLVDEVVFV